MSYRFSHGSLQGAFGNSTAAVCAQMQTMMPGTGVYMPGQICPDAPGKTGDDPPRPRICDGIGIMDVQNGLKMAGMYQGPIDGIVNTEFVAVLSAIAAAYNVPWDGDVFTVGTNLCGAIIAEVSKKAPSCSPEYGVSRYETGCVAKPTGPLMEPLAPGQAPPPEPPPESGPGISRRLTRASSAQRYYTGDRPAFQRARPPHQAEWMGEEYVGGEQKPDLPIVPGPGTEGIPTWVYIAAGAAVVGGVAFFVLKSKR
jgi:hypothetical protein